MNKSERLLQRVAIAADVVAGVPTVVLECGHAIGMPDASLTHLSKIRHKIAQGFKLVDLCPLCRVVPHPVCNPDPYWAARSGGNRQEAREAQADTDGE